MKKQMMIVLLAVLISMSAWAQRQFNAIPQQVSYQFTRQYVNVSNVNWQVVGNDNYAARFTHQGISRTVTYTKTGQWLVVENQVRVQELPRPVVYSLRDQFSKDYSITQVTQVERFGMSPGFRVRVRKQNGEWDVEFDNTGQVREKVIVYREVQTYPQPQPSHYHKHGNKHKDKHHHHCDHCHHGHGHGDDDD